MNKLFYNLKYSAPPLNFRLPQMLKNMLLISICLGLVTLFWYGGSYLFGVGQNLFTGKV
jgi:hypothetical protein